MSRNSAASIRRRLARRPEVNPAARSAWCEVCTETVAAVQLSKKQSAHGAQRRARGGARESRRPADRQRFQVRRGLLPAALARTVGTQGLEDQRRQTGREPGPVATAA